MNIHTRRRGTALLTALVGTALALTGCSSTTGPAEESPGTSSDAGFPATIDTAYGEITVNERPQRIVAFGTTYVELLSLLGEEPVGFGYDLDSSKTDILDEAPWAAGFLTIEPDPGLLTVDYTPAAEAIAALNPDLILSVPWSVDEQLYTQLSQIAPTYVGLHEGGTSWQEDLASLATLTGSDPSVVEDTQAKLAATFASAAEELPGLQGKSFQVAVGDADRQFGLYEYANASTEGIGLVPGEGQPVGEESGDRALFSQENIERLNADVVFIAIPSFYDPSGEFVGSLEADPRVATLNAAQNGTFVYLSNTEWGAINGATPSSATWWLEHGDAVEQLRNSNLNGQ